MMRSFLLVAVALTVLGTAVCVAQTANPVVVELLRPQSDDTGHYVAFAGPINFPIMGVAGSYAPITSVIVNGVSAMLFPVNYRPLGVQDGMLTTGFRVWIPLNGNSLLHVVATDSSGKVAEAAYWPDDANTLQRLQFWLNTAPGDDFHSLRIANAHAWVGDMDTALPRYERFITAQPGFLIGRELRALAQLDMGYPANALTDLNAVLAQSPDVIPPRLDLALALYQTGDLQGAVDQFRQILTLNPNLAEAHLLLGQVLSDQGDTAGANAEQLLATQLDPTLPVAHYVVGLSALERGDYSQALYSMRQSVQLNPRNGQTFLALAGIRFARGEYDAAWRALESAQRWGVQADPNFLDALSARKQQARSAVRPPL